MDDARSRLVAEQAEAQRRLADATAQFDEVVAASRDTNADDEHDPEGATIAFERSQLATHVAHLRARLADIAAALERVDDEGYGVCVACGRAIDPARLEIRPATRMCVACASRAR